MCATHAMQIARRLGLTTDQSALRVAFRRLGLLARRMLASLICCSPALWAADLASADVEVLSTIWQDHGGWIIFAAAAILAQALTIGVLVVNRRRKLMVERLLLQSEDSYHSRLDAALAQQRHYEEVLTLLLDLTQKSVDMTERQICDLSLDIAVKTTGSEIGYLHLLNEDQNTISLGAWNAEALTHCTSSYDSHYPISEAGIWADCARTRQTVIHNDYQNMAGKKTCPAGHSHLLRHMSTPVLDGDRVRMIVGVGNKASEYTQEDSRQLQMVAGEVQKIVLRRRAEQALGESEERLRFISDLSPAMIWATDIDKQCIWVNKTWLDFTGRSMAEELGQGWTTGIHPDDLDACTANYVSDFEARKPFFLEYRFRRHDGQLRWVLDAGNPRFDDDGEFRGYVGTCLDITERKQARLELELFETFFSLSHDMMAITGQDGYFRRVNRAFSRVLGYSEAELMARPFIEFILPEDRKASQNEVQRQLQGSVTLDFENRYCCKDGSVRALSWRAVADPSREVRYSTARDVTDLRAAQGQLLKLAQAMDQTSQSVVITSKDACIEYVNRAFCEVSGYSAEEAIGQNPRILQSGLTPVATFIQMWEVLGRGDTWQGQFINRRKNGELYTESINVSPVRQSDGQITHYLAIKENITEQIRKAEAVLQSKVLLQAAIDSTPDWIFVKDQDYRFMLVNEPFARTFNQSPEAMIGRLDSDFLPHAWCLGSPQDGILGLHDYDAAVFRGESIHLPYDKVVTESGETKTFDTFKTPMRDSHGKIFGALCYHRDITERIHKEQEQGALERQLQQAQKMELIGHLTGGIAHDFNNILASILGYAELMQMSSDMQQNPKLRGYLLEILKAGIRAKEVVQQLLSFSRREEPVTVATVVKPIVKEVVTLLHSTMPSSITIKTEIANDLPQALIGAVQLHQILMNLGINARDAIEGVGTIEVNVGAITMDSARHCESCHQAFCGSYLTISVRDNGVGISPENRLKIFDPFFTTKAVGTGSGLGLTVLHGIVHSARGHIEIFTGPGVGTEFIIYLPAQRLNNVPITQNLELPTEDIHVFANVMVVDDEAVIVAVFTELLEKIGCTVTGLTSSAEALRLFQTNPYCVDMVITDQTMPDLIGTDLARAMLALRPDIPIIMSTGYSASIDEETALKIGLRQLLLKPVPAKILVEAVTRHLDPKTHL